MNQKKIYSFILLFPFSLLSSNATSLSKTPVTATASVLTFAPQGEEQTKEKTIFNKKGEEFSFHGDGSVSVRGPFGEDLGTHPTNNDNPFWYQDIELLKQEGKSAVFVGLGLNGGCNKCHHNDCNNPYNCKYEARSSSFNMSLREMSNALDMMIEKSNQIGQEMEIAMIEDHKNQVTKKYLKILPKAECKVFSGDLERDYSTDVSYQVEINSRGMVHLNFALIYYSSETKAFRLETKLQDGSNGCIHSHITPDITLSNFEDTSKDYELSITPEKSNKIEKVEVIFRWARNRSATNQANSATNQANSATNQANSATNENNTNGSCVVM